MLQAIPLKSMFGNEKLFLKLLRPLRVIELRKFIVYRMGDIMKQPMKKCRVGVGWVM